MVAILLLGGLATVVTVPDTAEAQRAPPWFGPADRNAPTEGWAFRVPVVVTNDRDGSLMDHVAAAEIDFGRLLVDAGWISQSAGQPRPRGFTLDVDSIRVVEYERGFRDIKRDRDTREPVVAPHAFYPALFEATTGNFNASTNPAGTVVFRVDGTTRPDEARFYYVYFNALQYGDTPPLEVSEAEAAAVRAYASAGPGQVYHGYSNGAPGRANRVDVHPTTDDTIVRFYVYEGGQFRLVPPEGQQRNPLHLNLSGSNPMVSYSLPPNQFFKIEANHPIMVSDRGRAAQAEAGGGVTFGGGAFAMALSNRDEDRSLGGTFAGTRFRVPVYAPQIHVIATESGATNVQMNPVGSFVHSVSGCFNTRLDSSQPTCTISSSLNPPRVQWVEVRADKPVLVQYGGALGNLHQIPARSGAPTGTEFAFGTRQDDLVHVLGESEASAMLLDPLNPSTLIHPQGPTGRTDPAPVPVGCRDPLILKHEEDAGFPTGSRPYNLYSIDAEGAKTGFLHVYAGGDVGSGAGVFTGHGGRHVFAHGPIALITHYPNTQVEVTRCLPDGSVEEERFTLAIADQVDVARYGSAADGTRFEIRASKPLTVVSTKQQETYARFLPGRPVNPDVNVGELEFRGHLVDLRAGEGTGTQAYRSTGPGTPVDFRLTAVNLGRWIGGDSLPDTVRVRCATEREEWTVEGCDREFSMGSFQTEAFTVTITPEDAAPGDIGIVTVTAESVGAPGMRVSLRLSVFVEVTYGVDLRFDQANGPRIIEPPVSLNPGESHAFTLVLSNLGSVEDVFEVRPAWLADAGGWTGVLSRSGTATTVAADSGDALRVRVPAEETVKLTLEVEAPSDPEVLVPPDLKVRATSESDRSAVAEVTGAVRIRADISFELGIDARTKRGTPGEPVNFTLDLRNNGNDTIRVALHAEGLLPDGWEHVLLGPTGRPMTQADALNIGPLGRGNATLRVTPPADADAGTLVSLRLAAETSAGDDFQRDEVGASVVVRQVHRISVPDLVETEALPGAVLPYDLEIRNMGNGNETIEVLERTTTPPWPLTATQTRTVNVSRDDAVVLPLELKVPEATPKGLYDVNVTLRLSRAVTENITLPVRVPEVRQFAVALPVTARVTPGQAWEFPLNVRNTGNVHDAGTVHVDAPAEWDAFVKESPVTLAPGQARQVTLVVNASRDAADGAAALDFRVVFPNGEESTGAGEVTVGRPALHAGEVQELNPPRRGGTLVVSVPVENRGNMEAKDVRVALEVNGEIVDVVTLNRILPDRSQTAVLSWDVTSRARDVRVIVNPEETVVDAEPEAGKVVEVQFGSRLPVPGAGGSGLLVAFVVAGALGALRGRWRA